VLFRSSASGGRLPASSDPDRINLGAWLWASS